MLFENLVIIMNNRWE